MIKNFSFKSHKSSLSFLKYIDLFFKSKLLFFYIFLFIVFRLFVIIFPEPDIENTIYYQVLLYKFIENLSFFALFSSFIFLLSYIKEQNDSTYLKKGKNKNKIRSFLLSFLIFIVCFVSYIPSYLFSLKLSHFASQTELLDQNGTKTYTYKNKNLNNLQNKQNKDDKSKDIKIQNLKINERLFSLISVEVLENRLRIITPFLFLFTIAFSLKIFDFTDEDLSYLVLNSIYFFIASFTTLLSIFLISTVVVALHAIFSFIKISTISSIFVTIFAPFIWGYSFVFLQKKLSKMTIFVKKVNKYILVPFFYLLSILLVIYTIKNNFIIKENNFSTIVSLSLFLFFVGYIIEILIKNKKFRKFFFVVNFIQSSIIICSVLDLISIYGLTVNRILLILISILNIVGLTALMFLKMPRVLILNVSLTIVIFSLVVPEINIFDISVNNQLNRLITMDLSQRQRSNIYRYIVKYKDKRKLDKFIKQNIGENISISDYSEPQNTKTFFRTYLNNLFINGLSLNNSKCFVYDENVEKIKQVCEFDEDTRIITCKVPFNKKNGEPEKNKTSDFIEFSIDLEDKIKSSLSKNIDLALDDSFTIFKINNSVDVYPISIRYYLVVDQKTMQVKSISLIDFSLFICTNF